MQNVGDIALRRISRETLYNIQNIKLVLYLTSVPSLFLACSSISSSCSYKKIFLIVHKCSEDLAIAGDAKDFFLKKKIIWKPAGLTNLPLCL